MGFPFLYIQMKPLVLITAGEPLGIGPEITVKALQNPAVQRACRPVVIGEFSSLQKSGWTPALSELITVELPVTLPTKHLPSRAGGLFSYQAVKLAIKLALKNNVPLVTAPISKQSWALAEVGFTGHTELLRHATASQGLMMFVSGALRCALVTEHFALSHLPLTQARVEESALHFAKALKNLGINLTCEPKM